MKMRIIGLSITMILISNFSAARNAQLDSLKAVLESSIEDTNKVNTLIALSSEFYGPDPTETIRYATEARDLAEKINYRKGLAYALKSIGLGHYFQSNFVEAVLSWEQSLKTFEGLGHKTGVANMLSNLGTVYFNQGEDTKAIEYYLESLGVAEEVGNKLRIATALVNIGAVYSNKPVTYEMALDYYTRALTLAEELRDYDAIGTAAVNMGEIYMAWGDNDAALQYFMKSLEAYKKSARGNIPYALINIGKVYASRGNFNLAIDYQQQAYDLANTQGVRLEMANSLLSLAATYELQQKIDLAIDSYIKAQKIAEELGANYKLKESYEGLAMNYSRLSDFNNAFYCQALYSSIKDTLYNAEMDKRIQAKTLSFELEAKQGKVDLLEKEKALQELDIRRQKTISVAMGITGILILLIGIGMFNRYRYVHRTKKIIENEKALSDKLLLNVLPAETAEELKMNGEATPKHYDMVSVLFTDFKGFTKIAENLTPHQLVQELNTCFLEFDKIIDRFGLEKIKTIGDAYMCAGGIPAANETNPTDIVRAGIEIKKYMEMLKKERESNGKDYWELRIGIHTGPVIAGVVGKNKFAYDIWGDAVNTASRMESSGIPGKVNISGTTYELIKDGFECTHRGKIEAKNKGEIDMYIVEKENPSHSGDGVG